MKLIGLAGPLRVGKDTIADYLVANHGFIRFSFTDALYAEVRKAFDRGEDDKMVHPQSPVKEIPMSDLQLAACDDEAFRRACAEAELADPSGVRDYDLFLHRPRSPRWILQMWGTEYRRKQDPDYWLKRAKDFSDAFKERAAAGEALGFTGLVNTSIRFENEYQWLTSEGGEVWHVHRRAAATMDRAHEAERGLPVRPGDREIFNNSTIEKLNTGVSLLLQSNLKQIVLED